MLFLMSVLLFAKMQAATGEAYFLESLAQDIPVPEEVIKALSPLVTSLQPVEKPPLTPILPLSNYFPGLATTVPHISFGAFPTPVVRLANLSKQFCADMYVKCDGESGTLLNDGRHLYGGNKVRKLEILFADALNHGAKTVVTFGCAGSNHATATAVYAHHLGLRCLCMLKPQANSHNVQKNLLLMRVHGASIHMCPDNVLRNLGTAYTCLRNKLDRGDMPYFIPTGGSKPLGAIGFVNAAFELKEQIAAGLMPEPDYLYVPCGSQGTTAGLMVGVRAAGLKTKIIPVAVEPEDWPNYKKHLAKFAEDTSALLHSYDATFPLMKMTPDEIELVQDCGGIDYGIYTPEAVTAMKCLQDAENIQLDGTYTGKAFAGFLAHAQQQKFAGKVVLFWNTYCADKYEDITSMVDYRLLPQVLHTYFESPVQELDL